MKIKSNYFILILMLGMCSLLLTGCIPGDGAASVNHPAGFFWGIWHGWIAPISLIGSLFNKKLHIYEALNTGFWYDLGFYAAIISGFGGISLSRNRKNCKKD